MRHRERLWLFHDFYSRLAYMIINKHTLSMGIYIFFVLYGKQSGKANNANKISKERKQISM